MIELFPFQVIGSSFLKARRLALLADDMGVGKTAQSIDACKNDSRILVVCPSVAKFNWQHEFKMWTGRTAEIADYGHSKWNRPLVICSFDYLKKYIHKYNQYRRNTVIIDEAHYGKEPTSERSKSIFGNKGIIHHTDRLWCLSGTPAPNHAGELWPMLYSFGLTKLSYEGFIARYCNSYRAGDRYARIQIAGSNTKYTPELKVMLKKCSLRRLKRDVFKEMPPIFHNTYYVEPDTDAFVGQPELLAKVKIEHARLCERLDFHMGMPNDNKLLSVLMAMSQSVSALRRYHGMQKVFPVAELVREELELGLYKKILIFGIHTDVLKSLAYQLNTETTAALLVTGKMPSARRFEMQNIFQKTDNSSPQIFIGNIHAAGTNLTLTAASQVLFIENDWVPGNNKQAADRAHRYGQTHTVNVRHIAIKDSIDGKITAALTRKVQEISTFIAQ